VAPTRVDRFSHTLSRSEDSLAAGQESIASAELGSFDANVTPGVQPMQHRQDADATETHGRDARATGARGGVITNNEGRATVPSANLRTGHESRVTGHAAFRRSRFTLHDRSRETNPIPEVRPTWPGREVPEGEGQSPHGKYTETG